MDFEVPVTPLADSTDEPDVASNIILLPLPNLPQKLPQNPPPIAA